MAKRIREISGFGDADRIDTFSFGTAADSGTILRKNPDPASADQLYASSNDGDLMLIYEGVQTCRRLSPKLKKNLYDNIRSKL